MNKTHVRYVVVFAVALSISTCLVGNVLGQTADDESAIRASIESYVEAYRTRDATAVAQHWAMDGEYISQQTGDRIVGREAIAAAFAAQFAAPEVSDLIVHVDSIRFVRPDVAIEDGTATIVAPNGEVSDVTYSAVHVKTTEGWRIDSVRETALPRATPNNPNLKQLEWLVGDWVDQSDASTVDTSVAWTKNGAFLTANFRVSVAGMDALEGVQVIGWDPAKSVIRSWVFDSDGGFGEGFWSRHGSQWHVDLKMTLSDGAKAVSKNIYEPIDDRSYLWSSIGRTVDGNELPNVANVVVVRKLQKDVSETSVSSSAAEPLTGDAQAEAP